MTKLNEALRVTAILNQAFNPYPESSGAYSVRASIVNTPEQGIVEKVIIDMSRNGQIIESVDYDELLHRIFKRRE